MKQVLNSPPEPPPARSLSPMPRKSHWALWVFGGLLGMFLVITVAAIFTLWWIQRPIKPVTLSASEKAVVEEKLRFLGARPTPVISRASSEKEATRPSRGEAGIQSELSRSLPPASQDSREPVYTPGSKTLTLTERELNGLLNANTDLGQTVRIELGTDAINAYLAVPIPQDFPIGGGKTFRMRGRFRVSLAENQAPFAILEDVTVFGLSLPKDWLGGIKGENFLADVVGTRDGDPILKGVKSLQIKRGALVMQVAD